ncbi:MAG TPA: PAS domain S-box protein [Gammaproteobacteria bacterium]|nr:PAS domain S-box protein [Gammaproteobacteria bacterium]
MSSRIARSSAYLIAAAAVLVAFLIDATLVSLFGQRSPMIAWMLPIIVVALLGGTYAALVTTAVALGVGVWYFIEPPFGAGNPSGPSADIARLLLFGIEGTLSSWLIGSRTRALEAERRAAAELQEGEARAESVVENVADGIITIDERGRVISINASAERLFGYARAEVVGESVNLLMPNAYPAAHDGRGDPRGTSDWNSDTGGEVVVGKRKDGTAFDVELAVGEYRHRGHRYFTSVVRDVSERKRSEETLREQKEELETLLDSLPIAVLVAHDAECSSITGNPAAEALLRSGRGANLSQTAAPDERPTHFRTLRAGIEVAGEALPMQRAARTGERVDGEEFDLEFADGSVVHSLVYARPLFDGRGRPRGAVCAMQDVTEAKRVERELRAMDRRKDEFIAVLAHELRNPLAPLRTGLELLAEQRGLEAIESVRTMMERQVAHLVRLVDDLVDLSRITRADIPLRRSVFDLSEAVEAALEMEAGRIKERRHELIVRRCESRLPVDGDRDRLAQVFVNVLSNAARYMDPGGRIVVEIESKGNAAAVRVADTGFGIPSDRLENVFEMFAQVPEHRSHTGGGGLGIGLAVAREIVKLHGGTIEARSDGLGRGAEFIVRLPLTAAESSGPPPQVLRPEPAIERSRRILVVDDNVDAADSLVTMLKAKGHVVEAVYDGVTALQAVGTFNPEIVLLDVGMPGLDGYEVARRIRAAPGGKEIMLCALTGWGQDEDKARAREAGFDEHLTKPVSASLISALIAAQTNPVGEAQ